LWTACFTPTDPKDVFKQFSDKRACNDSRNGSALTHLHALLLPSREPNAGNRMNYILLITFSAVIMAGLAFYCWQRRAVPGGTTFSVVLLQSSVWMFAIAVMLGRQSALSAFFWYRISLVFVALLPVLLLGFTLQYIGRRQWISPGRQALAFTIPVITLIIIWTDSYHHLFFKSISLSMNNGLMLIDQWSPGPWFVVHSVYSFGLSFIALAILWYVAIRQFRIYRYQSIMIIAGTLAIILPNLGFAIGLIPPDVIILPFGFLFMGILLTGAIFYHRFFDIVPVARTTLLDIMGDGMIVMDTQDRIVDLNPAALAAIGVNADDAIGSPAVKVFSRFPAVIDRFQRIQQGQTEFSIILGERMTHYDVQISMLSDGKGGTAGRLVLFRDITYRKKTEKALRQERDKLKDAIATIKELSGLLPICSSCKKIRDDKGYWNQIESYISAHSQAEFSHGICPECLEKLYGDQDWYQRKMGKNKPEK